MSIFPREILRHKVRVIVHRACWRRFEGDEAGANALLDGDLAHLLTDAGPTAPDEATVNSWLEEDREEFDRAMLIGELVARRVSEATVSAPPMPRVSSLSASPSVAARDRRADVPAIADLLDDMLEQDRRTRTAV